MKHELRYDSRFDDGRTWIYRLEGDLYGNATGYAFQDEVRQRIGDGARRVILDLSGVQRIDSSGVGILVAIMWSVSHGGGGLVCAAIPPRVQRVLELAMLLEHVGHAPSVEEAQAKLDGMDLA